MKIRFEFSGFTQALVVLLFFVMFLGSYEYAFSQGAAVNSTGSGADPSAMLDVSSVNSGVLIPRLTELQKNSISSPATGLMIYQTDGSTGFWYYDGSAWIQTIGLPGATGSAGPTGATGADGFLPSGTAAGNTTYWDGTQWVVGSSNIYNNGGSVGIGTNNPASSASLELYDNSKGFLINRMSAAQRNAIASPVEGLQIFNTTTKCLEAYINNNWVSLSCYGFTCGASKVSDIDGNIYNTVLIGSQCWMKENLKTTTYKNGTAILNLSDNTQWQNDVTGAYCCYNNDCNAYNATLGKMYNWFAVNNSNGICPAGWHIPTDYEWCVLENFVEPGVDPGCNIGGLRGSSLGGHLKETGTAIWYTPNTGATNITGFSSAAGGYRTYNGFFTQRLYYSYIWSSTEDANNTAGAWTRGFIYNNAGSAKAAYDKRDGFSARCIKD